MVSQVVATLLLFSRPFPQIRLLAIVSLWAVVAMTVVSGTDYFVRFGATLRTPARSEDPQGGSPRVRGSRPQ
jgi:hypothetical protein